MSPWTSQLDIDKYPGDLNGKEHQSAGPHVMGQEGSSRLVMCASASEGMAQSQGWLRRCFKAFCKGFFVAVPVAVTFLDRVACVARVEGTSMQPSLNPGGSQSSDVVLLNHWKVRNFEVQRGDIVSLV
ncbi:mitochondrial inner membrane protease subunit 2 isoform X2, partial [Sigmodon hispidus]